MRSMWGNLNGIGKAGLLGVVVAALVTLFTFLNLIPWASKAEVRELKQDLKTEISDMRQDVREIRDAVRQLIQR